MDTSALSDVNGFERRTQNGEDGCKTVEEGSREGAGGGCAHERRSQRRRGVVARGFWETVTGTGPCRLACEWAGSLVLAFAPIGRCQGQSTQSSICASEKSSTGGPETAPLGYNNSKAKSKSISNVSNAQVPVATTRANGAALAKSARSLAIVEAGHNALGWQRVDGTMDRNEFVREVLTPNYVLRLAAHPLPFISFFLFLVARLARPICRS